MMLKSPVLLAVLGCFGCAYVTPGPSAAVTGLASKRSEADSLPPDPAEEKVGGEVQSAEWTEPVTAGSCVDDAGKITKESTVPCPDKDGILISESVAVRDALYRTRYTELRMNYLADLKAWALRQEMLEDRLKEAVEYNKRLQPNWVERHGFELGALSGAVLGVGMTVGVVYGVKAAVK